MLSESTQVKYLFYQRFFILYQQLLIMYAHYNYSVLT